MLRLLEEPLRRVVLQAFLTAGVTAIATTIVTKLADRLMPAPASPPPVETKKERTL